MPCVLTHPWPRALTGARGNARVRRLQAGHACDSSHPPGSDTPDGDTVTRLSLRRSWCILNPLPDRERAVPVAGTGSLGGAQRSRAHQAERSAAELTSLRGAHRKESATCALQSTLFSAPRAIPWSLEYWLCTRLDPPLATHRRNPLLYLNHRATPLTAGSPAAIC
jgi:hypothetical protein